MIKQIFIISILFKSFIVTAQSKIDNDSLAKYSYTVFGIIQKQGILDFGTCFFIERQQELFLVSTKHTFYQCDSSTNRLSRKFTTAMVQISLPSLMLKFTIPEPLDTCTIDYKDPDLFITKVDSKWISKVNSISHFLLPPLKNYGKLRIYGQGMNGDSTYLNFAKQHVTDIKQNTFKFHSNVPCPDSNFVTHFHNFIETNSIAVGRWMKGFSGAPVLLQNLSKNNWRFCGVLTAGIEPLSDKLPGGIIIIKADYVLQKINELQLLNTNNIIK